MGVIFLEWEMIIVDDPNNSKLSLHQLMLLAGEGDVDHGPSYGPWIDDQQALEHRMVMRDLFLTLRCDSMPWSFATGCKFILKH